MSVYTVHEANSRETDYENSLVKEIQRVLKDHNVESFPSIQKTATKIILKTTFTSDSDGSRELLAALNNFGVAIRGEFLEIDRPRLHSYGAIGLSLLSICSWIVWGWWLIKDMLILF